ncbi:MAG TPA: double-strand break repair helicase AddA [Ensifer sp.]|nr:double-strand break repair helicase AddA [Ensifer sp.]
MAELLSEPMPADPLASIGWTTRQQGLASDPMALAWVSANAGSGKTHVLTQRVIRLLLAGARPSAILCLTYTKAAASEMSNRVFRTLSKWALLDDAALSREIEAMEGRKPGLATLAEARRLFARALETPGGLKIQTIHAFCEALLHQFPLEANVAGHFTVLDERAASDLIADVRRNILVAATAEDDADLSAAFATVMDYGSDSGLETLIGDIVGQRSALLDSLRASRDGSYQALLRQKLGLPANYTRHNANDALFHLPGFTDADGEAYLALARQVGGAKVLESVERLGAILTQVDPSKRLDDIRAFVFTQSGSVRGNQAFFNAAMLKQDPLLEERVSAMIAHVSEHLDALRKLDLLDASSAALTIAERLVRDYEDLKRRLGYMDFEDLIERAASLLTRSDAGPWIHYKLDQGIDHILVDEAQDTSPVQWRIIRALSEEFFAGKSARNGYRTLFAVGDEKQSIYSFQGARPEKLASEGRHARAMAQAAELEFRPIRLPLSFRSTGHVLSAVDQVFSVPENRRGLGENGDAVIHQSSRIGHPGLTEVWEMIAPTDSVEEDDWTLPFDATPETTPPAILARRIADTVAGWIGNEIIVEDGKARTVRPGDVLVLVRKRDGFVNALTRALKSRNAIPVGGADRLVLTRHIAVQDLMTAGRFILLPEDDLSLAALSKSPLMGLSEDDLMLAAAGRDKRESLWARFQSLAGEGHAPFVDAVNRIGSWRRLAESQSPFDFFSRILGPMGGRRKFFARLGTEVTDVLDEFLALALDHGAKGLPGLQSFISALELDPPTVKREQDKGRDEVRIMTVHASKGLEAPIVFLVDDGSAPFNANHMPKLRMIDQGEDQPAVPVWLADSSLAVSLTEEDAARRKALAEEEYRRLLYVGMTRAADRLIICGHRKKREIADCWHKLVWSALAANEVRCREAVFKTQTEEWGGLVWTSGEPLRDLEHHGELTRAKADFHLPASLLKPLVAQTRLPRPLSPSGAAAELEGIGPRPAPGSRLFGETENANIAIKRGKMIHRLFQVLPDFPVSERRDAAGRYLARAASDWHDEDRELALNQVFAILDNPDFASLFDPTARAEANLMGVLATADRQFSVAGRIDRLAVEADRVIIADFKTDRAPPKRLDEISRPYVAQLAIYREILRPLYPDRGIECRLIFTTSGAGFCLTAAMLDDAMSELGLSGAQAV